MSRTTIRSTCHRISLRHSVDPPILSRTLSRLYAHRNSLYTSLMPHEAHLHPKHKIVNKAQSGIVSEPSETIACAAGFVLRLAALRPMHSVWRLDKTNGDCRCAQRKRSLFVRFLVHHLLGGIRHLHTSRIGYVPLLTTVAAETPNCFSDIGRVWPLFCVEY